MADTVQRKETPSLTQVIRDMIDQQLLELHTAMPGEIVEYDYNTNLAVVQPVIKRKFKQMAQAMPLPLISNVPVFFPSTKDAYLRLPIAVGDEGQIIFQERSIDNWLENGGVIDPLDPRKFHLSDAVFYPGLRSKNNALIPKGKTNSVVIKNSKSVIEIMTSGKFKITNGKDETFDLLVQLVQAILDSKTNTLLGPQPLINPTGEFNKILQAFTNLRGQ